MAFVSLDNFQTDPISCPKVELIEDGFGVVVNIILLCFCGKLKSTNDPSLFPKIGMLHFEGCCVFTSETNNNSTDKIHCILLILSSYKNMYLYTYIYYILGLMKLITKQNVTFKPSPQVATLAKLNMNYSVIECTFVET